MKKELLLRASYSEDMKNLRLDMRKTGMNPQEALGILEMAKDKLLEDMRKQQTSAVVKK